MEYMESKMQDKLEASMEEEREVFKKLERYQKALQEIKNKTHPKGCVTKDLHEIAVQALK